MNAVRRLRARSPIERRLLAHALVLHSFVVVALRLVRYGRIRHWGSAVYGRRRIVNGFVDRSCVLWAVRTAAATLPFGRTCLSEALTAHWLMAACGHESTIRFGVAAGAFRSFTAHAWLEPSSPDADAAGYAPLSHAGIQP